MLLKGFYHKKANAYHLECCQFFRKSNHREIIFMIKLLQSVSIRLLGYITVTVLGMWFYLNIQATAWYNTILCGVLGLCLSICFTVDAKVAIDRL